jgi:hypothetical protein
MTKTYTIFEKKEPFRSYDTVGTITLIPMKSNFESLEEAENYLAENGSCDFGVEYVILPIYNITFDDIKNRKKI